MAKRKSGDKSKPKPVPLSEEERLIESYSDRTNAILARYRVHDLALGKTKHHGPTGERCEDLIRDEIRRVLRPGLVAEFGYVWGRVTRDGIDDHSPEADILIYDESRVPPVEREGGIVHVLPDTVRGIIQVKKHLTKAELRNALQNVATTKQHIIAGIRKKRHPRFPASSPTDFPRIFSAVVGITGSLSAKAKQRDVRAHFFDPLSDAAKKYPAFVPGYNPELPNVPQTAISTLPQFLGSLTGYFAVSDHRNQMDCFGATNGFGEQRFQILASEHQGHFLALQAMLYGLNLSLVIFGQPSLMLPFFFPLSWQQVDYLSIAVPVVGEEKPADPPS